MPYETLVAIKSICIWQYEWEQCNYKAPFNFHLLRNSQYGSKLQLAYEKQKLLHIIQLT